MSKAKPEQFVGDSKETPVVIDSYEDKVCVVDTSDDEDKDISLPFKSDTSDDEDKDIPLPFKSDT